MNPLNLPKESIDALLQHATMFITPITDRQLEMYKSYLISKQITNTEPINIEHSSIAPYQIDDEVYFDGYKATIRDVKVVRVHDIFNLGNSALLGAWSKTEEDFKDWYNKRYGDYEDNPYVFLYEVKEIR